MKKQIFITSIILLASSLFSQEALKSTEEEYYDFLSLQGIVERPTLGYRTLSDSVWNLDDSQDHVWQNNNLGTIFTFWEPENPYDNAFTRGIKQGIFAKLYGPEWYNSYNSAAPHGQNDGALWQGRGYNTALTGGIRLEGYGFELTFKPQISFSQNMEFEFLPGVYGNPYSYNWKYGGELGGLDLVQRYGDKPFFNYDWGESEIRWSWHTLTLGFGNQSPWLGPAYINPMLGSNNAASYTKFDIGLRKTSVYLPFSNTYIGDIEGRIWIGQLKESKYFDYDDSNDLRMLASISGYYSPSFIPGFTLGLNRIFLTNWATHNFKYILRLVTLSRSNGSQTGTGEDEDQKFSITGDWVFPKVGFRVYTEFGRDDFSYSELCYPLHTAIYTLGFEKEIPLKNEWKSVLNVEYNNFEMSQDYQFQQEYIGYYVHHAIKQGYTNKGQIIGAGTGYFGNSQFIQYKVYYPNGAFALKFHRHSPNNNSIFSKAVIDTASNLTNDWYQNFETNYDFGIDFLYILKNYLMINQEFVFTYTVKPMYKQDDYRLNCFYALTLKWEI